MGFENDIRPLFSEWDRREMDWLFDLWSYPDVRARANQILERLEDQTMPCDRPWDDERIAKFSEWIKHGCPP